MKIKSNVQKISILVGILLLIVLIRMHFAFKTPYDIIIPKDKIDTNLQNKMPMVIQKPILGQKGTMLITSVDLVFKGENKVMGTVKGFADLIILGKKTTFNIDSTFIAKVECRTISTGGSKDHGIYIIPESFTFADFHPVSESALATKVFKDVEADIASIAKALIQTGFANHPVYNVEKDTNIEKKVMLQSIQSIQIKDQSIVVTVCILQGLIWLASMCAVFVIVTMFAVMIFIAPESLAFLPFLFVKKDLTNKSKYDIIP